MKFEPPLSDEPPPLPAAPLVDPPPVKRLRWWIHLLLIAGYPLAIGLAGYGSSEMRGPALSSGATGLLVACVVQMAVFGLVIGLAWLASRASRDDLLWRWRGGFWPVPLGIGYSVGLRLMVGIVAVGVGIILILTGVVSMANLEKFTLANRPDVEAVVDVSAMRNDPLYFWLTLTLVSFVVAGFREELWRAAFLAGLRRLWPRCFGSRTGQVGAAGVAAVIFGLGHLPQGVIAVAVTGLLGFGLGLIMVLHRSIWPAVIAHGMFDATSLALIPWALEKLQGVQKALGH
ncbi:MAG: CPBP family intramembrane glutamic endopeptidase [Verrucomicrobiota bacterium]